MEAEDPAVQQKSLQAVKSDLLNRNIFSEGFIYTPLAADVESVDPMFHIKGKVAYQLYLASTVVGMKSLVDTSTLEFDVTDIQLVDGDFDPFVAVDYPPVRTPKANRDSKFGVYFKWEMSGKGAVQMMGLVEQKPLYISGQDVFRFDSVGKVFRIDSSWDQDPMSFGAYFNPLAHITALDTVTPLFKNSLPKRKQLPVADDMESGDNPEGPGSIAYA